MDAPGWDGVEIVYNAKEERKRKEDSHHSCSHIYPSDYKNWKGTVTVCPECGVYWHLVCDLWFEQYNWKKVRWWNFRAKRRIKNGT